MARRASIKSRAINVTTDWPTTRLLRDFTSLIGKGGMGEVYRARAGLHHGTEAVIHPPSGNELLNRSVKKRLYALSTDSGA